MLDTNLISIAYPFSAVMVVDKFDESNNKNYFQIKGYDLPEYRPYEGTDIKIQNQPVNQIVSNFTWSNYRLDVFLSSDYYEYKVMKEWMDELKDNRDRLRETPGLLTTISTYILDVKQRKIQLAMRFRDAFPIALNGFRYEKSVEPLMFQFEFKYLNMEIIPEADYEGIILN